MINAMITVRSGSTRLPGKCFMQLPTGKDVLTHVIERCRTFGFAPIVATTDLYEDDRVAITALAAGARIYRGSVNDKMQRWLDAAIIHDIKQFVVVDCDDPLFDPDLTKNIYDMLVGDRYDYVLPDMRAYLGSHGMSVDVNALGISVAEKVSTDTEMVQKHIHGSADVGQFHIANSCIDSFEQQIRLTLDYPEDLIVISKVIESLGPMARRDQITDYFRMYPTICTLNQFRNAEWRRKQEAS